MIKGMAEKTTEKEPIKRKTEENVIFVGQKPPMSYVLAIVTEFNKSSADEVVIKARGRFISKAVDAAEIARNRFVKNSEVKDIKIDTENITSDDGKNHNVSSIEIYLSIKKKKK